jgi:ADP-ribose pyrophosphatase YjhB (NUDIX family)
MPITPVDDNLTYVYLVVGSVIEKDGKFLLVQEKKPSVYGLWNLPAGKAEKQFSLEENAAKEVKEETGYDAKIVREIAVFHKEGDKSVKHTYLAEITDGELKVPEDEILDAKWFSSEEIKKMNEEGKIRDGWAFRAIDFYKNS